MGRYSERYWDDSIPPLAEAAAAIVTAGLTTLMDDHGVGYGCEITDHETGLIGTTSKYRSSKTKAHDDAWEDLMEKQHEYYEIQAEQEKELREREYAKRATKGGESDLIGLVVKAAVYIALFVLVVWLVLVALIIAIINIAIISLIIGLAQKKGKKYLFILSLIGGIFVVADYNSGWFTKSLTSNASFLAGLIPFFFYLNISAGLVASYFLVRDSFNERKPPAEAEGEFSRRNLYIMASLLVIGTTTVLLQRYFDSKKSFESISASNSPGNQNIVVADTVRMVDTARGVYPQASIRFLTSADLSNQNKHDLKIMRNEIFARHGYIFRTPEMKSYFAAQRWYKPLYNNVDSQLSSIEKANVELIKSYEK